VKRHHTTAQIRCYLSFWTRLKLILGWQLIVVLETSYKIHDPGILGSKCVTGTVPPWRRAEVSQ
jgi:hypothetical protein